MQQISHGTEQCVVLAGGLLTPRVLNHSWCEVQVTMLLCIQGHDQQGQDLTMDYFDSIMAIAKQAHDARRHVQAISVIVVCLI